MVEELDIVLLSLALEVAQLSKAVMHHDDGAVLLAVRKRDEDGAIVLVRLVELAVDPYTSLIALADIALVVDQEACVTGRRRFVDQCQAAFLDDRPTRETTGHKLDDERADLTGQLIELERLRQNFGRSNALEHGRLLAADARLHAL